MPVVGLPDLTGKPLIDCRRFSTRVLQSEDSSLERRTYWTKVSMRFITICLFLASIAASVQYALADSDKRIVAKAGATEITAQDFMTAYERARRQRFYHGAPPSDQQRAFQREVAKELITRVLLLQEAERRRLKPNWQRIQAQLDSYDKRYSQNKRWQQAREQLLAALRTRLAEDDQLQQLEQQVRQIAPPTVKQLLAYYQINPEKFTEPARDRISLILLGVDPSAASAVWEAARRQAEQLTEQLRQGADFAELARLHSIDASAKAGGDMGYLHSGMLSTQTEHAIARLKVGDISEPIMVLEGIAIVRLDERKPAQKLSFNEARERIQQLWRQERSDQAWQALRQELRATTPVEIYDPALRS